MWFTVAALAIGLILGFVTGGRPSNVGRHPMQLLSLLLLSVVLQVVAERFDVPDTIGLAMVLASYVGLLAFAGANIRLVGMPVVLIGLLANLVVIAANGGMPVRESAIYAAHASTPQELPDVDFGAKRHLADGDRLEVLGDIVPVRPTREVLSFGDLILAFGISDVVFRLLRPADRRRRHRADDVVIDLARSEIDARVLVNA